MDSKEAATHLPGPHQMGIDAASEVERDNLQRDTVSDWKAKKEIAEHKEAFGKDRFDGINLIEDFVTNDPAIVNSYQMKYIKLPLNREPLDRTEVQIRHEKSSDTLIMGYVTNDPDHAWEGFDTDIDLEDHADIGANGALIEFQDEWERDQFVERMEDEGRTPLVVNKLDNGLVHYSVVDENEPVAWDEVPAGVLVPSDELQEQFDNDEIDMDTLVGKANDELDQYARHLNGEMYQIVIEQFYRKGMHWKGYPVKDVDGIAGPEEAKALLTEEMGAYSKFPSRPRHEAAGPGL